MIKKGFTNVLLRAPDSTAYNLYSVPAWIDESGLAIHKSYHVELVDSVNTAVVDHRPDYQITHINSGIGLKKFTYKKLKNAKTALEKIINEIPLDWNQYQSYEELQAAFFASDEYAKQIWNIYLIHREDN